MVKVTNDICKLVKNYGVQMIYVNDKKFGVQMIHVNMVKSSVSK